jgi:hypothetical protein
MGAIVLALMFLVSALEDLLDRDTRLGELCSRRNLRWAVVILTVVVVLAVVSV